MTQTPDSNLEATTSEEIIEEPVSIELENPAEPDMPLSADIEDPSPEELESDTRGTSASQKVLNIVNNERRKAGLKPLRLHSRLNAAAQAHSNDMAKNNFFSHVGSDGSRFDQRIRRYGYNLRGGAENITAGPSSPEKAESKLMYSPGHRKNILNGRHRDMGIAYARGCRY